jgi:acetylornithine deacetylase
MDLSSKDIKNVITELREQTVLFLSDLIRFPSIRGSEGPVNRFIHSTLSPYCDESVLMQIPESFKQHPLYSWPMEGLNYYDTQNLRMSLKGSSPETAKSLILNAHSDVVPPSKNQERPFDPVVKEGILYGRGACDDKGQIAVLYLVIRILKKLGVRPRGNIWFDIVVEEENGGNGTLFMTLHPVKAHAAIVLEASEYSIYPAVRGAVWFELTCYGKPGHSGRASDVVSALKESIKAMDVIEQYHNRLLVASRGKNTLFDQFENPMPVTFGMMNAGDWPATAPGVATVKGVFGFLPNSTIKEVQQGMIDAIKSSTHPWLRENFDLKFNMLNNDGNEIPVDHPLVVELSAAMKGMHRTPEISAMTAACDAWRYNNALGIPTVVMGAGSLKYAHSNQEQIAIEEIEKTAAALVLFIHRWCTLEKI